MVHGYGVKRQFQQYSFISWRSFYWWRKPQYPEETAVPRENRSTRRKPQYPEETAVPGGNRSTRRKPQYPEETGVPGGNRSTRRKPQYPEETAVPGGNHRPAVSDWQTLSHNFVSSTPRLSGARTHSFSGDRHRLHRFNGSANDYISNHTYCDLY
jgi:hypothetical protein